MHAAELNLSYTQVYAPVSGVVGHKTVELGHRVQPGQTLLTVVPIDDIWITANFKETQLRQMRPGQPVTLHADSFDHDYRGVVEVLAGASGPLFRLQSSGGGEALRRGSNREPEAMKTITL